MEKKDVPQISHPRLSDAEVLERARLKVRFGSYVIGPQARDAIGASKRAKRQQIATTGPDLDYHTTIEEDLLHVITTGAATKVDPLTTEPYWSISVRGIDDDGFPLIVHAYLYYEENEALMIWNFIPCQKGED